MIISSYGPFLGGWERRRPVWLLFLLQQLGELQTSTSTDGESNARGSGEPPTPMLDVFLAQEAQTSAKQLYSIETPDEVATFVSVYFFRISVH